MNTILATIHLGGSSGESGGLIQWLLFVLAVGICALLIWLAGRWFIKKLAAPEPVPTIWDGFFILVGLVIVINFIMGIFGHPIIAW